MIPCVNTIDCAEPVLSVIDAIKKFGAIPTPLVAPEACRFTVVAHAYGVRLAAVEKFSRFDADDSTDPSTFCQQYNKI